MLLELFQARRGPEQTLSSGYLFILLVSQVMWTGDWVMWKWGWGPKRKPKGWSSKARNLELRLRVPRIPCPCGSLLTLTHTFQLPLGEAEQLTTCVSTTLGDSEGHGYPLHFKKYCRGVGRQNHRDTQFSILFLALQMSLWGTQGRFLMELRAG